MKAFAWQSGQIGFGRKVPEGALLIASAPARKLRAEINATARHAYHGPVLLVPGVPEAESGDAKVDALITYCKWIEPRFKAARK